MRVVTPSLTRPSRKSRRPNFPMAGIMKPYGLYPLMATPVLPGETMAKFDQKIRVVSKPVKHPLAGSWFETWLCYVKLTDLDRDLGQMFISDDYSTTGWTAAAANARTFTRAGQIDWINLCLRRVWQSFFANQGESVRLIDGVPQVKLSNQTWMQNLMFKPDSVDATQLPSVTDEQLTGFQMAALMGMSELTYENYLKQFGVQSIVAGPGEPEILRYTRSWAQPVNTVEPSTGAPSSAFVWSEQISSDKPKRFDEPGFVIQIATIRPKMYLSGLVASFVGNLWGFSDWFPVYNLEDPVAGVREILSSDQVFLASLNPGAANSLLYDHRDLLSHGEQFVNAAAAEHPFALPWAAGQSLADGATEEDVRGEYASLTSINAIFSSATAADQFLYYEGLASVAIDGHVTDTTLR